MRENFSVFAHIEHNYKINSSLCRGKNEKSCANYKNEICYCKFCKTLQFFIFDDFCSPIYATPQFLFKPFFIVIFLQIETNAPKYQVSVLTAAARTRKEVSLAFVKKVTNSTTKGVFA